MSTGEQRVIKALMREGFDAEIVRATVEGESMVVLFTIAGTSGKRLGMTARFSARQGSDGQDRSAKVEIFEGFV